MTQSQSSSQDSLCSIPCITTFKKATIDLNRKSICKALLSASFTACLCFSQTQKGATYNHPSPYVAHEEVMAKHKALDDKAAVMDASRREDVAAVYDALMKVDHLVKFPVMDDGSVLNVRDKFIDAEMAYWQSNGKKSAVTEKNIVDAFNLLADKLDLPDEARTTVSQVHYVAHFLIVRNPAFEGHRFKNTDPSYPNESVSRNMSPLQALHLARSLIDGKTFSAYYAVSPKVWEQNLANKVRPAMTPGTSAGDEIGRKIAASFAQAVGRMSDVDGLALLTRLSNLFGVK